MSSSNWDSPRKQSKSGDLKRPFIGLQIEVIDSPTQKLAGSKGIVIDETKETFIVRTEEGEIHFPKKGGVFRIGTSTVMGDDIRHRPEERIKRI
ncbi:MAG: ribonuclease P protein subunit [Candidatus Woesearchaeota archaeon]